MKRFLVVLFICILPLSAWAKANSGINQPMEKAEDWVQVVENSSFQLGVTEERERNHGRFLETAYGTYPSLDGSTVSVPMAREFARQHLNLQEAELDSFVRFSTTHDAYVNLIEKKPNVGAQLPFAGSVMALDHPVDIFIGTEPSLEEWALAEENDVKLIVTPICYDAFVFIVNERNPVENLTVNQIQAIYMGLARYWEDAAEYEETPEYLLDEDGESMLSSDWNEEDTEIRAYTRQRNSGSQTAMENLVMQGKPLAMKYMNYFQVFEMSSLVNHVGNFQNGANALGYTYLYYIDTLYRNAGIKTIAIDGVQPTNENIRSGEYPFSTCYYAVTREGENTAFVEWMISPEGQKSIAQAGYIPYLEGV